METFFISHGSPTLPIDESLQVRHFLKAWKEQVFLRKPNSILVISAHWETDVPTVNVVRQNDTIYDFYGFPEQLYKVQLLLFTLIYFWYKIVNLSIVYWLMNWLCPWSWDQLKYPAPGAPDLAKRVKELLWTSGFNHVKEDTKRGLDHGAWTPLMLMYPEANIPVCQLSLQPEKDGTYHYNVGKALTPLKDEGVLIIGSGSATHNLKALQFDGDSVVSWASEFDCWLKDALLQGR